MRIGSFLVAAVSFCFVAPAGRAQAPPLARTDQVVPVEPPAPAVGLWASIPGVPAVVTSPQTVSLAVPADWSRLTPATPDPLYGPYLDFKDLALPAPRLELSIPPQWMQGDVFPSALPAKNGKTISFFYRHPAGLDRVQGYNPLVLLRATDISYATVFTYGVALKDGVPVVIERGGYGGGGIDTALGDSLTSFAKAIDDGQWHHIVLRIARPGCGLGVCSSTQTRLVTLYVDGDVRAEAATFFEIGSNRIFFGALPVQDTFAQTNFVVSGQDKFLNTIANLDDFTYYQAALSSSEIGRIESTRRRGLRFQMPSLDPVLLGSNGESPRVGELPATGLASTTSLGNMDLLSLKNMSGPAGFASTSLKGLREHTFAAWVKPYKSTTDAQTKLPVFEWKARASDGWKLEYTDAGAFVLTCRLGGTDTGTRSMNPEAGDWHLVNVRLESDQLILSVDQRDAEPLACALPAAEAPALWHFNPSRHLCAWVALYAGAKGNPELAAIASPGPAIWLDPTKEVWRFIQHGSPSYVRGPAPKTNIFTPVADGSGLPPAGTLRYISVPVAGSWAAGTPDGRDFTLSFEVRVDRAPADTTPMIIATRRGAAGTYEAQVSLARASADSDRLVLNMRLPVADSDGTIYMRNVWTTPAELVIGRTVRVSIAWPFERELEWPLASDGLPISDPEHVVEPSVVIDGLPINRSNLGDIDPLFWGGADEDAPASSELTSWVFGDPDANLPAETAPRYALRYVRVHPRSVVESLQIGMTCDGAGQHPMCSEAGRVCKTAQPTELESTFCGGCDATHVQAGGVSEFDQDCVSLLEFGERCATNAQCASGACAYVCLAKTSEECRAKCDAIGKSCNEDGLTCSICKAGFQPIAGADQCVWTPTKATGELCDNDGQCLGGMCRSVLLASQRRFEVRVENYDYDIAATKGSQCQLRNDRCRGTREGPSWTRDAKIEKRAKVCLARAAEECTGSPKFAAWSESFPVTQLPDLKPPAPGDAMRYACSAGEFGGCRQGFERRFPVLSPSACEVAGTRALTALQTGRCHVSGPTAFNCSLEQVRFPRVPAWGSWFKEGNALSLRDLKLLFLGEDSDYVPSADYRRLIAAGVGELLISYAGGNATKKAEMAAKYGKFEPIASCAEPLIGVRNPTVYDLPANYASCEPRRLDDGARCPPPGGESLGIAPNKFCKSNYCSRDDQTCERGDNPLTEIGASAGNKNRSGKSAVKFGLVRVDDTRVDLKRPAEEGPVTDANAAQANQKRRYQAWVNQSHVLCIMGQPFPRDPIFETRIHLDRTSEDPRCSSTDISTFILGFKLTSPKPEALAGSCTGYSATVNSSDWSVCTQGPGCTPTNFRDLASGSTLAAMRIPVAKFCLPMTEEDGTNRLPEFKRDFKQFLVPLYISFGPTLDICINASVGLDQSGMPQLEIRPHIGVGVEAKAGAGSAEQNAYEIGVGVRLALKVVDLAFPLIWGFEIKDAMTPPPENRPVDGLLEVSFVAKRLLEVTYLAGEFGLFATFGIGPFSLEWTLTLFKWEGLKFAFTLSKLTLATTKLDFRAEIEGALERSSNAATCDSAGTDACYQ